MRILCIGDSLGMPRPGVDYNDTWYYKLSKEFKEFDFVYGFVRALSSDSLNHPDFCENYNPNVIICQLGIVDCAPRIINEKNIFWSTIINVIERVRGGGKIFWWVVKKIFRRNNPKRVYVKPEKFRKNIERYIEMTISKYDVNRIIFIKIAAPSEKLKKSSPFLSDNVNKYNEIYEDLKNKFPQSIDTVDSLCVPNEDFFVEDGYHINRKGNELVFRSLRTILSNYAK